MITTASKSVLEEIAVKSLMALGYSEEKHNEFPDRASAMTNKCASELLKSIQERNDSATDGGDMYSIINEEVMEFVDAYQRDDYVNAIKEGYHIIAVAIRMILVAKTNMKLHIMKKGRI